MVGENINDGSYWAEASRAVPTTKATSAAMVLVFLMGICPLTRRPLIDVARLNSDNAATEYETNVVLQQVFSWVLMLWVRELHYQIRFWH
jgi:hypothetical protein